MKKIHFIAMAFTIALVTTLTAGVLISTEINGTKTYCYYSDGDIKVINGMGICPATN